MVDKRKNTEVEVFPIYAPTLGIIGHIPPTMLDPRACVDCNNVRFKDGVVSKRTGYATYGTGAIEGTPLMLFRYQMWNLTEYEILVTTSHVYYKNNGAWAELESGLSGTVDIRASLAYIQNYLVFTNGVDAPAKCLATVWTALDDRDAIGDAIGTISLNAGGTGYTAEDIITVVQIGGSSGTVTVNTVEAGVITEVTLLTSGSGYTVADDLAVTGGTGTGAKINILTVISRIGWADYRPKIFVPYKDRLIGFNDNVSGSETAIRQIYSVLGDFDNVNDTGSGYNDFVQGMGAQIMGAAPLKDYIAVYKDYSCCLLDYIGGSSLYGFYPHIQGIGLAAQDAIANLGTSHLFLGTDLNIHEWNGGWELNHIGDPIKKLLQAEINRANIKRSFAIVNMAEREATFFLPIGSNNYPTRMWTYNLDDHSWAKGTIASVSGGGSVSKASVERSLIALSASGASCVKHYDYESLNDDSAAISAYYESGDFVLSKEEYMSRQRRFYSVGLDIKGSSTSAKLSLQYSSEEGAASSYSTAVVKDLTASYIWTLWDFLTTSRKLRFKFSDATAGQSFSMRFYGLNQKEGEIA